jgi:hypothetical protein
VQSRKALVEGSEAALIDPRELREVGVSHLPVADDAFHADILIADFVRPEVMPRITDKRYQQSLSLRRRVSSADEEAHCSALRSGTGGKRVAKEREPCFGRIMVDVIRHEQSDQDITVDECSHSSSSSDLTSSEVMIRPTLIVGSPVLGLRLILPDGRPLVSPLRMSHATVSLSVQRLS